jgi:hypothetical protein
MDLLVDSKDRVLDTEAPFGNLVSQAVTNPSFTRYLSSPIFSTSAASNMKPGSAVLSPGEASPLRPQVKLESLAPDLLLALLE